MIEGDPEPLIAALIILWRLLFCFLNISSLSFLRALSSCFTLSLRDEESSACTLSLGVAFSVYAGLSILSAPEKSLSILEPTFLKCDCSLLL